MAADLVVRAARRGRAAVPSPRLWAALTGRRVPSSSVAGPRSGLAHPEGVALTDDGELMAVANAKANSVTLYASRPGRRTGLTARPVQTLSDPVVLRFAHDVAFSPGGLALAVAARDADAVCFYARNGSHARFGERPVAVLSGEGSAVAAPAGVAFHPSGAWLAVANRAVRGLSFHRCSGDGGDLEVGPEPFQSITEEDLLRRGLAAPHALAFSHDGTSLVVVHKCYVGHPGSQGFSGVSILGIAAGALAAVEPEPRFATRQGRARMHSVTTHPSTDLVALTDEDLQLNLYEWGPDERSWTHRRSIRTYREWQPFGPKGIAFTPDGRHLALTTVLDQVLFYRI